MTRASSNSIEAANAPILGSAGPVSAGLGNAGAHSIIGASNPPSEASAVEATRLASIDGDSIIGATGLGTAGPVSAGLGNADAHSIIGNASVDRLYESENDTFVFEGAWSSDHVNATANDEDILGLDAPTYGDATAADNPTQGSDGAGLEFGYTNASAIGIDHFELAA